MVVELLLIPMNYLCLVVGKEQVDRISKVCVNRCVVFIEEAHKDIREYLVSDARMKWRGCSLGDIRDVLEEGRKATEGESKNEVSCFLVDVRKEGLGFGGRGDEVEGVLRTWVERRWILSIVIDGVEVDDCVLREYEGDPILSEFIPAQSHTYRDGWINIEEEMKTEGGKGKNFMLVCD